VSTHVLVQTVGVAAGQPATHEYVPESPPALEHVGLPASHALPQLPQLAAFVKSTQPPSHALVPPVHVNAHPPSEQAGTAWAIPVHAWPQAPQLLGSVALSTHTFAHWVTALAGQVATHAWLPLTGAHTGAAPLHALPHAPQWFELAGSTHPPSHAMDPNEQPVAASSVASPPSSELGAVTSLASTAGGSSGDVLASQLPVHITDTYEFSPLMMPHAPRAPTIAAAPTIPPSQRTPVMLRETQWGRKRLAQGRCRSCSHSKSRNAKSSIFASSPSAVASSGAWS